MEQKALTDSRFVELGRIIGADRHAGLGRMVHVWNECQERGSVTLQRSTINNTNPDVPDFCAAIVQAELACEVDGGAFYIRGTPGRIEWLEKSRRNGKKGAGHGVKGGRPKKTPDGVLEEPRVGLSNKPPLALALALAPAAAPKAKRTHRTIFLQESPAMLLAVHLRDCVGNRAQDVDLQAWARDFQKLLDKGRDFDTLTGAISYATKTQPENFLSAGAFASNWKDGSNKLDVILLKMGKANASTPSTTGAKPIGDDARHLEEALAAKGQR